MRQIFILDTNVMLHDPKALLQFKDADLIIPIEVLEEIDRFKHNRTELGRNSREFAHRLDSLRKQGNLSKGIVMTNGSSLRIHCHKIIHQTKSFDFGNMNAAAASILSLAKHLQQKAYDDKVVIISKNVNLRLKADALEISVRDYNLMPDYDGVIHHGWHRLKLTEQFMNWFIEHGEFSCDRLQKELSTHSANFNPNLSLNKQCPFAPNEYFFIQQHDNHKNAALCKVATNGKMIHTIPSLKKRIVGIKPLNMEQTFTINALLDDEIDMVTLTGKAGTGKTLLALAAGLHKVFVEDVFDKVLIFRPTLAVSRDIGFLPGDVEDKMRPWMQPIYDSLDFLRNSDRRGASRVLPADIKKSDDISIEPLTYIRGRSIPNQFIIIDESQNLTPLEIKTVITRVGKGSKIIFTGDPQQIDNPYIDSFSNGLSYLINQFRGSPLAAHITLNKGERSQIAETAANIL